MKIHEYIKKLQGLSDIKKQIILYSILSVFAVGMGYFWIQAAKNSLTTITQSIQSSNLPQINIQDTTSGDFSKINDVASSVNQALVDSSSQTTDSSAKTLATADWETYKDYYGLFEIQYPKNWQAEENIMSQNFSLIFCLKIQSGCAGKTVNVQNKNEDGPIWLFIYPKGDKKPSNPAYHYLGTSGNGFDYYLYNEFPKNESLFNTMIPTFQFTNTTK